MKKFITAAILATMLACGPMHTADTIDNTARAAAHEADLELCLQTAQNEKKADAGADKINADYTACKSDADKKAGKQ